MYQYYPKVIEQEKDLLCRSQHQQPVEFVILNSELTQNQRLLCKSCDRQNQSQEEIMDYQQLKQIFDNQHKEKIFQYEIIIKPHIQCIESLQAKIESLKTRLIQQLDNLHWFCKEWISALQNSVTSYSFFQELDKLVSKQISTIDSIHLIEDIKKIHKDWNLKVKMKMDKFKLQPEFLKCQEIFQNLDQLTQNQDEQVRCEIMMKTTTPFFQSFITYDGNYKWQIGTQEQKAMIWDQKNYTFIKTLYQIRSTKEQELQYIKDEKILRCENIKDLSEKLIVLINLEQVQYLEWVGLYVEGEMERRDYKGCWWIIQLKQKYKNLKKLYSNEGKKQGRWTELIQNYWSKAQVLEVGDYISNYRKGIWAIIYQQKQIGGGLYSQEGNKQGIWTELSDGFFDYSQVTYKGEYANGKKVGQWDILYKKNYGDYKNEQIGGGEYDQEGNSIKIGKWIDLDEGFRDYKQVTYNGEYQYGKKIGRWDTFFSFGENQKIGGGLYYEGGTIKIGKWIELDEEFWYEKQVTYDGEYQNGKKVGHWNTLYQRKQIGGGMYEGGNKFGKWIELDQRFYHENQVIYNGEYKNGQKFGRWNTKYRITSSDAFLLIGGGSYCEGGNCMKVGAWIDLDEGFDFWKQVTYKGEYKNGKKVGRWYTLYKRKKFSQCIDAGGVYNEGDGSKIGVWIELDEEFNDDKQVIYKGEFKNGKKVGLWVEMKRDMDKIEEGFEKIQEIKYDN